LYASMADGCGLPPWKRLTSLFAAPLRWRGRTFGFLFADRGGKRFEMTATQLEPQSPLAHLARRAIQHPAARQEALRRRRLMLLLEKANHAAYTEDRLPVLLQRLARIIRSSTSCRGVAIFLREQEGGEVRMVAAAGPHVGATLGESGKGAA